MNPPMLSPQPSPMLAPQGPSMLGPVTQSHPTIFNNQSLSPSFTMPHITDAFMSHQHRVYQPWLADPATSRSRRDASDFRRSAQTALTGQGCDRTMELPPTPPSDGVPFMAPQPYTSDVYRHQFGYQQPTNRPLSDMAMRYFNSSFYQISSPIESSQNWWKPHHPHPYSSAPTGFHQTSLTQRVFVPSLPNNPSTSTYDTIMPDFNAARSHQAALLAIGEHLPATGVTRRCARCRCPNCLSSNPVKSINGKKEHICHFPNCKKVYGKTSHLKAHIRWHLGERPFVCHWMFCGKSFTRSDELQRHLRTHTGEKKFQCSVCDKKFMRSDHLSKHIKIHEKKKKKEESEK